MKWKPYFMLNKKISRTCQFECRSSSHLEGRVNFSNLDKLE